MVTREQWLGSALAMVRHHLHMHADALVPDATRVSCGFPGGASRKAIGQCWSQENSADGSVEIFVSPTIADPVAVLAILVHEAIHAAVGIEHGHKAPFKRVAVLAGLTGKMTATVPTETLTRTLETWAADLGVYPHATLSMSSKKKQSTRLIKCECPVCGYTVRTTQKWIDASGAPFCGAQCSDDDMELIRMSVQVIEGDSDGE